MSVINQMLKDLEQRTPETNAQSAQTQPVTSPHSSIKVALITAVSVLVICLMTFYIWQLTTENKALKERGNIVAASTQLTPMKKTAETDNNLVAIEVMPSVVATAKVDVVRKPTPVVADALKAPISKPKAEQRSEFRSEPSHQPR